MEGLYNTYQSYVVMWSYISSPFTTQYRLLMPPWKRPFENIVGKGENAGYHHFLLLQQFFDPIKEKLHHKITLTFSSAKLMLSILAGLQSFLLSTLSQMTHFDSSNTQSLHADDNIKFDENDRKIL